MTVNFTDALQVKGGDIERPALLPVGTYRAVVDKIPAFDVIGDGKWDTVDFPMKVVEAGEDVDAEALAAFGPLTNVRLRRRFMFSKAEEDSTSNDQSMFNLRRFLEDHLLIDGFQKKTLKQSLADAVGQQCLIYVRWRADKNDAEIQYAEIGKTLPLE